MSGARILFKLSGSIAAWKACAVISRLVQDGHEVQTVATTAALRFIGAASLEGLTGRAPKTDLWASGTAMDHINLLKWADLVVLCPATANTINGLAAGRADDLLGALFLAHDWRKPYLVAPAMNPAMWSHPATRESVEKLQRWGVRFLPVGTGRLACGDEGAGRLLEPDEILAGIRAALPDSTANATTPLAPTARRVLITSGGTEEPVDGVRALGNSSTGRTGALFADQLAEAGHEVVLLRARRSARPASRGVRQVTFTSFADLEAHLRRLLGEERFDVVVHAAAVSDYSVAGLVVDGAERPALSGKLASGHDVTIRLRPNPKLVDQLRQWSINPQMRVVAFKLTREADADTARRAVETLFEHSRADCVVHNDLSELDEAAPDRFPATLWFPDGSSTRVATRRELATALERLVHAQTSPKTAAATAKRAALIAPA